jgi:hypothetical protein
MVMRVIGGLTVFEVFLVFQKRLDRRNLSIRAERLHLFAEVRQGIREVRTRLPLFLRRKGPKRSRVGVGAWEAKSGIARGNGDGSDGVARHA